MAHPMFIYFILLVNLLIISINATSSSNLMKARDSNGKSFLDGLGVVSNGQSITIDCNHQGNISWTRTDLLSSKVEHLKTNEKIIVNGSILIIKNIDFSDAMVYYCDQAGVAYRFYLNVYDITQSNNGTVPMLNVSFDMNGINFVHYKINEKSSANVSCTCDSGSPNAQVVINWKGGGYTNKISEDYSTDTVQKGSAQINTLVLKKLKSNLSLYGEYTCSCNVVTGAVKTRNVYLNVLPIFEEHESSIRTAEGLNITLTCKVWSYPPLTQPIQWRFQNSTTLRPGITISSNKSNNSIEISQLIITFATQNDRGVYTCHAENKVGSNIAGTMIRIKGRYAALWPFIGILVQIIILAIIIIVYEWKKSHQPREDTSKFNYEPKNEQDPGVAIRGKETTSTDVRQRLMVN